MSVKEMVWFGIATLIILAIGIVDDVVSVGPIPKIVGQIAAATIVVSIGWQVSALRLPFEGRFVVDALGPMISIFWIVGVTNAINFVDGLDGLAAGIVAIISLSLLILASLQNNPETVVVTSCIAGACIGFLRHNWRPARIYMGDSGSLMLGFVLAALTLRSSAKAATMVTVLVPLLTLGLPIIDTVLVIWYRFLRGHPTLGRLMGLFYGDRKHIHHLLLETRVKRSRVTFALYGVVLLFCAMAVVVAVSASWRLGLGFLLVEITVVFVIRRIGLSAEAKKVADQKVEQMDAEESEKASGVVSDRSIAASDQRLGI